MDGTSSPIKQIKRLVGMFFQDWIEGNKPKRKICCLGQEDNECIHKSIEKMQSLLADHATEHPETFQFLTLDGIFANNKIEVLKSALDELITALMEGLKSERNEQPLQVVKAAEISLAFSHELYKQPEHYTWKDYYHERNEAEEISSQLIKLKLFCSSEWISDIRPVVRKYTSAEMDYLDTRRHDLNDESKGIQKFLHPTRVA